MGALNNVIPFCLIVWGQTHIESGLASILNATTPIFSVVLAHFFTRQEKLTINRVSGIMIGWIGVSVLIGIDFIKGTGIEVIGQIAVLGAAISYAFAAIYGRRFKNMNPIVVATGMLCGSTIMKHYRLCLRCRPDLFTLMCQCHRLIMIDKKDKKFTGKREKELKRREILFHCFFC